MADQIIGLRKGMQKLAAKERRRIEKKNIDEATTVRTVVGGNVGTNVGTSVGG